VKQLLRAGPGSVAAVWAALTLLTAPAPNARAAKAPPALATPTGTARQTPLQRVQRMAARLNAEARTPEGESDVVARLTAQLHVAADSLRNQKDRWGVGYGELAMVYGFARAGWPQGAPERVVELRRAGMDWPSIAKDLGVKVDAVATRMSRQQRRAPGGSSEPGARSGTVSRR